MFPAMAVGVIAKETYRDIGASLNEVSHQITSDVALRNKSSPGGREAQSTPKAADSHSICERAGWSLSKARHGSSIGLREFVNQLVNRCWRLPSSCCTARGKPVRGIRCVGDRGWGKPMQAVEATVSVFDQMTDDEQKMLLAALASLRDEEQ